MNEIIKYSTCLLWFRIMDAVILSSDCDKISNHVVLIDGVCIECPIGTYGANCTSVCPYPQYGRVCEQRCYCSSGQICHPMEGCVTVNVSSSENIKCETFRGLCMMTWFSLSVVLAISNTFTILAGCFYLWFRKRRERDAKSKSDIIDTLASVINHWSNLEPEQPENFDMESPSENENHLSQSQTYAAPVNNLRHVANVETDSEQERISEYHTLTLRSNFSYI